MTRIETREEAFANMRNLLIWILTLGVVLLSEAANAQAGQIAARVPVLLAIVDTLPDASNHFRILRLAGKSRQDVVLLPSDAGPDLLTEALETLRIVWSRGSADATTEGGDAMFRRMAETRDSRLPRVLPWADRVLHDLRDARPRHVPGVGQVKAVQIWLAPLLARGGGRSLESPNGG